MIEKPLWLLDTRVFLSLFLYKKHSAASYLLSVSKIGGVVKVCKKNLLVVEKDIVALYAGNLNE